MNRMISILTLWINVQVSDITYSNLKTNKVLKIMPDIVHFM